MSMVKAMLHTKIYPDFIVVDGSEGGTGAAPIELIDYMGTPLREGLLFVHNTLVGAGLRDKIKIGASGKLSVPLILLVPWHLELTGLIQRADSCLQSDVFRLKVVIPINALWESLLRIKSVKSPACPD